MQPLLEVVHFEFAYAGGCAQHRFVLNGDRFAIGPGAACSLHGANMSGKTTFVRIVSGHFRGSRTRVTIDGVALSPFTPARARALGVAGVHQHDPLFPDLTIWDNVKLGCPQGQMWRERRRTARRALSDRLAQWGGGRLDDPLRSLSGGAQVLVRLLRAVLWEYKILLLDEPTTGLDVNTRGVFFDLLFSTLDRARAVLFVSHIDADHATFAQRAAQCGMRHETAILTAGCIKQRNKAC